MKRFCSIIPAVVLLTLSLLVWSPAQAQEDVASWDKAVSLYKQNQFQEAIAEFKRVLVEFPTHAESWKFTGLAYYQLKEYDQAIAALGKALELKKAEGQNTADLLLILGRCHLALNHYEQALPYLESLIKLQSDNSTNYYLLGFAYANLKRPNEAVNALKNAVKLDPKDSDSWYYLGVIQLRAGKLDEAVGAFRSGVSAAPNNLEIINLLAETLVRRGLAELDTAKANTIYEEAIRTAVKLKALRDDAASTELLGRIYLAAKKYTSAELTLARALALTKEPTATLYFNLGLAHAQNKAWARAAEMLLQSDRLSPANVDTLNYLGFVYENLRKYPQAIDAYNRAYEASGRTNPEIKEAITRVTPLVKLQ